MLRNFRHDSEQVRFGSGYFFLLLQRHEFDHFFGNLERRATARRCARLVNRLEVDLRQEVRRGGRFRVHYLVYLFRN